MVTLTQDYAKTIPLSQLSVEIDTQLRNKVDELIKQRSALYEERVTAYEEYRAADPGHDRSENAPLDAAIAHIKEVNGAMIANESTLRNLSSVEDLINYNAIGLVVPYSTVRLRRDDGEEMCYRIYPPGVSYPEILVIAEDSRLAIALMGKEVGDVVGVSHTTKHKVLNYEILEIH